jgi:hypothetical protein
LETQVETSIHTYTGIFCLCPKQRKQELEYSLKARE